MIKISLIYLNFSCYHESMRKFLLHEFAGCGEKHLVLNDTIIAQAAGNSNWLDNLQKELNAGSIHDTFVLSARILRQLSPDSLQAKIIKAIALIYMLEQFERLQPTQEEILDIFGANNTVEEIKEAIDDLIEIDRQRRKQ